MFVNQQRGHIPTLGQEAIRVVPKVYFVKPTSVRVELDDLLCAKAQLKCSVKALGTEEVVKLVVVCA